MKKLFSFLMIAAMLIVASCNRPEEGKDIVREGDLATVTFTVNAGDILTKAVDFGNASSIDELLVQVFNLNAEEEFVKLEAPEVNITPVEAATPTWDVQMKLAKNETYKIAFWAQKAGNEIYNTADLSAVSVDYSKIAINSDDADVFCAARLLTVNGTLSETVELYRPLAQVNVGTNDLAAYKKSVIAEKQNLKATITLPAETTPTALNVIGGAADEDGVVAYTVTEYAEEAVVFAEKAVLSEAELTSNSKTYDYLTMVYVLAEPEKSTIDFSIKVNNSVTDVIDLTVSNMPFQANYRTNIVGQLLTGTCQYTVEVEKGFFADLEKQIAPAFASVEELNAYFATMEEETGEGDNGDVDPEEVSVSAVASGDIINLPKIAGDVVIRVNAVCNGTLTVQYGGGADDPAPANIYLYVKKATNLVVNTPASHVELIDDSWVTETITAITSGDTFVVGSRAKVGTVKIQQGNANIAGEVATIEVVEGATDGEGAPVELFLEKESAVGHIDLNAPANVVVEQPAGNIDVAATENKVSVDVNVEGCSATAQNGGQIYVTVKDGVTSEVTAEKDSAAKIADEGAGVTAIQNDGGQVVFDEGANVTVVNDPAAKIGDTFYTTLEAAFAAVEDGVPTTIKLVNHYVIMGNAGIKITANKNVTLDLAGWKLSNAVNENKASQVFNIQGGTLTIMDSVGEGEIFNAVEEGTEPGEWWSTPQYNYATNVINNCGTLIINSGTLRQTAAGSICYAVDNNSTSYNTVTTLNGGVLTSNGTTMRMFCNSAAKENKLIMPAESTALLEGNYTALWIQLPGSDASSMKNATLQVAGGTIKGNTYAFYDYSYGDGWDNVNYEITGGKLIGWLWTYKGYGTENVYKFVTGGTFTEDPSAYVPEGYEATQGTDGLWTIVSNPGYIFENDVVTIYAAHGLSYVSNNYADFRDASHNLTIKLDEDIDMTGKSFSSFNVNNYTSVQKEIVLFTFDGQNHTITGMEKMLIAKTWAGHSSFEVKNLTLNNINIEEDVDDATESVGVGAICGWAEASTSCKIINVKLVNSSVIGGHWTGGLVGYATGYDNPNDGPVLEKFTVENCSVEGCTIKGKGSVGALVAHAAGNNATLWEVSNFTSKDNILLNTAGKTNRTGALIGTLGLTTGSSTAYPDSKVGVYFTSPLTVSGNTVNGEANDNRKIGRKGSSDDDKCYLDNENVVDAWLGNN